MSKQRLHFMQTWRVYAAALSVLGALAAVLLMSPTVSAADPRCANPADTFDAGINKCVHYKPSDTQGMPMDCEPGYANIGLRCAIDPIPGTPGTPTTGTPGAAKDPKCAVVNYGPIACPKNAGIPPDADGCFIRDPGSVDPVKRNWQKVDCKSKEYTEALKPPGAISCDANTPVDVRQQYCDPALACTGTTCNLMVKYVNPLIKAIAALVGVAVTVSIIFAGIQYASSADDPQKVSAAKRRIVNSLLTLIGFFLFFAFLNWVIPGGIK